MRLLVVTPTFLGEDNIVGGAEEYVFSIVLALSKLKQISSITVLFFSPERNSYKEIGKVKVYGVKTIYSRGNPSNPIPPFSLLSYRDYDVVYLHQFNTWLTAFYSLFGKLFNKKVILTDHNGGGVNYNKHLKIHKMIDINFHTSNISKEDASVQYANNKRIFGGVNTEIYRPIDSVERKNDFLFVGRLHPIKGIDLLIEASKKCQKPHSLTLAISSNSFEEQNRLLEEVENNSSIKVIFNESKEELVNLYNSHRWICLSSKKAEGRENLGLTVLEGLACGAKAACSPHCGIKEMKEEFPTSDILVVEDWDSFFEEFAGKEHRSNSVEWIKENGTWDQVALRLFNNL